MRRRTFASLILTACAAIACSSNEPEEISDKSNSGQDTPVEYPTATGEWIEARTFMMQQEDDDVDTCDQVDFRVMANSGIYSINECAQTKSGQLTAEEFSQLDRVATSAYKETEGAVCPEIFRFDKYYATINATNDEFDRNFDPDSSCYRGTESVVKAYKTYLRQLLDKYRTRSAEE